MVGCAKFAAAVEALLAHEGTYADDPRDPGGETQWGITHTTWLREGGAEQDWEALSVSGAVRWYHDHWWVRYGYEQLDDARLAGALFNFAVNAGPGDSHRAVQRALNLLLAPTKLAVDGQLGPVTRAAINQYPHPAALLMAWKIYVGQHYIDQRRPHFLAGWLNRLESL